MLQPRALRPSAEVREPASPMRRASPSARLALCVYVALLVYASLYPLSGWRDSGLAPWTYFNAPWPRYLTRFDVLTNLLAYMPLGVLTTLAAYPRWRREKAFALSVAGAAALAGVLEAIQTYLPNRVASNVDLGLNTLGATLGAFIVSPMVDGLLERGALRNLRRRWFESEASGGVIVAGLWLVALLIPQRILFGLGEIVWIVSAFVKEVFGADDVGMYALTFTPEEAIATEVLASAFSLAGAALLMLQTTRPNAPRMRLVMGLATCAVGAVSLASAVVMNAASALRWASPGAQLGLLLGTVIALAAAWAPARVRLGFAIALIAASAVIVNLAPADPYFAASKADWHAAQWANFAGLLRALGACWPFIAVGYLLGRLRKTASI